MNPLKQQRIVEVDVTYQEKYPNEYEAVMYGVAFWYPHPIKILGHYGKYQQLWDMSIIDMDHPKCYYCGKFVKKGDWWKGDMTGPCYNCDDPIDRYGMWT